MVPSFYGFRQTVERPEEASFQVIIFFRIATQSDRFVDLREGLNGTKHLVKSPRGAMKTDGRSPLFQSDFAVRFGLVESFQFIQKIGQGLVDAKRPLVDAKQ